MASTKRKSAVAPEKRAEKKLKTSTLSTAPPKPKPNASQVTVLRDEEQAFPRGGSSILTPLERRQIQNKAREDVLFEQSTGKKVSHELDSADGSSDDGLAAQPLASESTKSDKKSQTKRNTTKHTSLKSDLDSELRIDSLSYKRLFPGSVVLGQVAAINKYDVNISLPNNLTGYVPLTSISEKATQVVEELAQHESSDSDGNDSEPETEEFRLQDYVRLHQYVRAYVTAIGSQEQDGVSKGGKRHITLSLMPEHVNGSLSTTELVENNVIQASVTSIEDHGVVMNIGIGDSDVKAFMGSKEVPSSIRSADLKPGAIMLCLITGKSSNGKIIKLSANEQKLAISKKGGYLTSASSVDAFQPGSAVEILVSSASSKGVAGKVMGLLDATADILHSKDHGGKDAVQKRYPIGSKVKARVICTFPSFDDKKIGVSFLPHLLSLSPQKIHNSDQKATKVLPPSSIIQEAKVVSVEQGIGVFMDVGVKGIQGFAHISRLSDEKVASIAEGSGAYKVGTTHKARVLGYNAIDGHYLLSLEKSILEMPFINLEDVQVGAAVKATVEKFFTSSKGGSSIILRLTKHIDGLVPEIHISDVQLQNPEKKFREGSTVNARVLSVDLERRRVRLTLKRSLVNSEAPIWTSYDSLSPGDEAPGTIVNILSTGAVIQYYGNVRGFLPVSQMSETFIKDPKEHFRVGQVVTAHILSVEPETEKMTVSCRDDSLFGPEQQQALNEISIGSFVDGVVSEKTNQDIILEIGSTKLKAILHVDHLADGSAQKCLHAAKKIRVSQTLKDMLVVQKLDSKKVILLSKKPSLIKARNTKSFPSSIDQLEIGEEVVGYVRSITDTAVFVQFAADLVGLLPRAQIDESILSLQLPSFGLRRNATITTRVKLIDAARNRFVLTQRPEFGTSVDGSSSKAPGPGQTSQGLVSESASKESNGSLAFGSQVEVKISSVKESQLNVTIAEGVQGRIDISQVFDEWEDIKDRKKPLNHFKVNEILRARVIGTRNHRNHKFLPITHVGRSQVYELTAKKTDLDSDSLDLLTLERVREGDHHICYVNNVAFDCLWVNISPRIRGRIRAIDASDDTSILSNLAENFPSGSAVRARVLQVDSANNRLDLSARTRAKDAPRTFSDLVLGQVLPAKVTRVSERQVIVQLSDTLSGPIHLVELADDYTKVDPNKFQQNQIIRVHVSGIDAPNKRMTLSARPSKTLSSSLPVLDKDFQNVDQLKVNDIARGFVKNVADNGVFIALSSKVTAFVRVAELSDKFIKDWKAEFEIDSLMRGKIISVDVASNHIQMSLKQSIVDNPDYRPPITYRDLKVGQTVTGKIRQVKEDLGVFLIVDNSANVSGLCHRSELADENIANIKSVFEIGDNVKAKVLRVDHDKRRVAFGLKASYFLDDEENSVVSGDEDSTTDDDTDLGEDANGVPLVADDSRPISSVEYGNDISNDKFSEESDSDIGADDAEMNPSRSREDAPSSLRMGNGRGLNVGSLDWEGQNAIDESSNEDSDGESEVQKPKKKRRASIQIDRTDELDINGPQSTADFERLLLNQPNSSYLWLSYMAHYLQLNETNKARQIAERAIKTVNHQTRETEDDALNVWVGFLNLENTFGTEETIAEVFARANQYNDPDEIHSRLASILIQSQKNEQADTLFQSMVKKFSQNPKVWLNYADFLFDTIGEPVRGRDLLPRALQALPKHQHFDLITKFAQLEFRSSHGDSERGRTMFENLLSTYPKRLDLYNILIDLEQKIGDKDRVRRLFQRVTGGKLKQKQARYFYKRWVEYEEKEGDAKSMSKVKARAEEYERRHSHDE